MAATENVSLCGLRKVEFNVVLVPDWPVLAIQLATIRITSTVIYRKIHRDTTLQESENLTFRASLETAVMYSITKTLALDILNTRCLQFANDPSEVSVWSMLIRLR